MLELSFTRIIYIIRYIGIGDSEITPKRLVVIRPNLMEHVAREFGLLPFKSDFGRMNTVVLKKKMFHFLLGVHTSSYSVYKYSFLCQLDSHRFYKILHYNFHGKQINSNSIQQLHIDRLKCAKHNTEHAFYRKIGLH